MRCLLFNDTATSEIYTLSLHDALPISPRRGGRHEQPRDHGRDVLPVPRRDGGGLRHGELRDRKSTRLNSSHANISYAVFCLKKKNHCDPPVTIFSPFVKTPLLSTISRT